MMPFKKILNTLSSAVKKLISSRGCSPARLILTGLYIYAIAVSAPRFMSSLGNYKKQAVYLTLFIAGLLLLIRSVKRIFDAETRRKISGFVGLAVEKLGRGFYAIGEKIKKAFGFGRMKGYGEERDFIFGERKRRGKKRGRLHNPLWWRDQEDNSSRIRYIFTEYMITNIKNGYKMRPSETPRDIERKTASTDEDHVLFDAYEAARYSGGRREIDDDTVEALREHFGIKK